MNTLSELFQGRSNIRCARCGSQSWNVLGSCAICEGPCCDAPECHSLEGPNDELICAKCTARLALEKQDELAVSYAESLNLCATEAIFAATRVGQMSDLLERHIADCAACSALIPVTKRVVVELAKSSIPEWKEVA